MTPANERKTKERQAKRDAGLVRVEVWVPRDDAREVRAFADDLCNPPTISAETLAVIRRNALKAAEAQHRAAAAQLDQPTTKG